LGELTTEIVPVFSSSGQGMVTEGMAVRMEHPCHGGAEPASPQRHREITEVFSVSFVPLW